MKKYILLILQLLIISEIFSQTDNEFWFVAPEVTAQHADRPVFLRFSTLDKAASIIISQPANRAFKPISVEIAPFNTKSVDLTSFINNLENTPPDQILNKGILIKSTEDITVYYEVLGKSNRGYVNTEIFSLKGYYALGNYFLTPFQTFWKNENRNLSSAWSSFNIVATEDNTTIYIIPSKDVAGHKKGEMFSVKLNKGQTYCGQAAGKLPADHLAGTRVISDKPIAITVSDDSVLDGVSYDLIGDQIVPVKHLGNKYIFVKGGNSDNEKGFICATENNTNIYISGNITPAATINMGETYAFNIGNPSTFIYSDKNVYAFQVSSFGDELGGAILPEINCSGSKSIRFTRSTNEPFALVIIARSGTEQSFSIDGDTSLLKPEDFKDVAGTNGQFKTCKKTFTENELKSGVGHWIENDSSIFQMGIMNGTAKDYGFRFGFFSSFGGLDLGEDKVVCAGQVVELKAGKEKDSFLWNTGATTESIIADTAGIYSVLVRKGECEYRDTVALKIVAPIIPELGPDQSFCMDEIKKITADSTYLTYSWNTGQNTSEILPDHSGLYRLSVTDENGCIASDSINITLNSLPEPQIYLSDTDINLCKDSLIYLRTDSIYKSYQWDNNDSSWYTFVESDRKTSLSVEDKNGCKGKTEVTVDCSPFINTFNLITPDGDGKNEYFIIEGKHKGKYKLNIYNRWGDRVYENNSYDNSWSAHGLSDGIYYFSLDHIEGKKHVKGWVQILRKQEE